MVGAMEAAAGAPEAAWAGKALMAAVLVVATGAAARAAEVAARAAARADAVGWVAQEAAVGCPGNPPRRLQGRTHDTPGPDRRSSRWQTGGRSRALGT